jgi:hypothetical protein
MKRRDSTPKDGMSFEEIARALGRTNKRAAGCVYVQYRMAIRKLWTGRKHTFHDFSNYGEREFSEESNQN